MTSRDETSEASIHSGGDMSIQSQSRTSAASPRDAQFVVVAAAEGVKAACAINKALQLEELKP